MVRTRRQMREAYGALPPFPIWEGVLATEIGEPGNTDGWGFCSDVMDWEIRSITSTLADALPDLELFPCAIGVFSSLACANTLARACANYSFITD